MVPYLKSILFDRGAFLGAVRALMMGLGLMAESGRLSLPPGWEWLGLVIFVAGAMMRSSVPAPTVLAPPVRVQAMAEQADKPAGG